MSSRTVTDQAGLDAALAESVERIYIDSPAGVWLSVVAWGGSHVVAWGSSHVEARGSSHVEAWESSHVVAWGSSHVEATACVAVHLHSASAEVSGGVIIDLTTLDLANLETWRGYIGADTLVDAKREQLVVGEVSSQRHPGRLNKSGLITIGCWAGSVEALRELAVADEWPSGASAATRSRVSPRLLACADLCEQQLAAWASVEAVAR